MSSVDFKNTPCHPVRFKFKETGGLHCLDLQVEFVYCITLSLDGSGVGLANVSLIQ